MEIEFSIIGYIIMLMFYAISGGLLILLWYPLRRTRWWKPIVIPIALVFLVLPWADEVWIAWHFHKLCEDAGVHVYKKVIVQGFYDDILGAAYDHIRKEGYGFTEGKSKTKGYISHVVNANGKWEETLFDHPTARYVFKYSANNEDVGWQLEKQEWVVVDSETDRVIGRETTFKRYPGWIETLWRRFFGIYPEICEGTTPNPPELRHLLYSYVLIPADRNRED